MTHQSAHVRPRAIRGPTDTFLWALCALGCALLVTTDQALRWERLYLVTTIIAGVGACTRIIARDLRRTREHADQMYEDSLLSTEAVIEQVVGRVLDHLANETAPMPTKLRTTSLALVGDTPANGVAMLPMHTWRAGGH